jgi:hypothetical protein
MKIGKMIPSRLKVELRKDPRMETFVEVTAVLVQGAVQRRQGPRPFPPDRVVVADLVRSLDRGTDAGDREAPHASSTWDLSEWPSVAVEQMVARIHWALGNDRFPLMTGAFASPICRSSSANKSLIWMFIPTSIRCEA